MKGASAVAGMQIHNRREKEHSNSNPDIDHSRSSENYALVDTPSKSYNVLADERIEKGYTGKKAIRKDAVKVVEGLFTSDSEFFKGKSLPEQKKFFSDCLNWAENRFGKENIIAATVHMDEATPHLHVDFVPLTSDGRLSAKSMLGGKKELQQMQDDFYKTVGEPWGMERGNRADLDDTEAPKPRKHLETADFKRQKNAELDVIITEKEKAIENLTKKESSLNGKIEALQTHTNNLEIKLTEKEKALKTRLQDVKTTDLMINEIKNPSTLNLSANYKTFDISKKTPISYTISSEHLQKLESAALHRLKLIPENAKQQNDIKIKDMKIKSLSTIANRVPILENELKNVKNSLIKAERQIERTGQILKSKEGLLDEFNTAQTNLREQESIAREIEAEVNKIQPPKFKTKGR
jgi:hypothetical protein